MSYDPFAVFAIAVAKRLKKMQAGGQLLQCHMPRPDVWTAYLAAFPSGTDPIHKEETEHTCNSCKAFFRQVGNVAVVEKGVIRTLWHDLGDLPAPYDVVAAVLADAVASSGVQGGLKADNATRHKLVDANGFNHFHGVLEAKYHTDGRYKDALDSRVDALEKLSCVSLDALETVKELIAQNQVYRGQEFRVPVNSAYLFVKKMASKPRLAFYDAVLRQDPFFLGSAIGTLVTNLSEGMDTEGAVGRYEAMVAPSNYKRPKPVISKKMVEKALATVESLGLGSSLHRRMAVLGDISVANVDWSNADTQSKMRDGSPLEDLLLGAVAPSAVSTDSAVAIHMEAFLTDVLPKADEVDLYVANAQTGNLVALTAPSEDDPLAKALFDWGNSFGWSYRGGVTDSIKERVKRAGGSVDGLALRVSLAWANHDDLDLHAQTPHGHLYYGNRQGVLDVDMNVSSLVSDPVENMAFRRVQSGIYRFRVHNYTRRDRGGEEGFSLQVQIGDKVHCFNVPHNPRHQQYHDVDLVIAVKGGIITISQHPGTEGSTGKEIWGINTEAFVPVGAVLRSPNHWDGNNTGNKHWFFALQGCMPDEPVSGIYNEFLGSDLHPHRKVFEVLSRKALCQPEENALCGLGFSTTRKEVVTLRVKAGSSTRLYNVTIDA